MRTDLVPHSSLMRDVPHGRFRTSCEPSWVGETDMDDFLAHRG